MQYIRRLNHKLISEYLKIFKAVLLVGPKYSGKTTLAKQFANSEILITPLNLNDYRTMLSLSPGVFFDGEKPKLIDEWQLLPEVWDLTRHQVDKMNGRGFFILTGSSAANLDNNMHSGAGRIGRLVVRPMSLYEVGASNGSVSLESLFRGATLQYQVSNLKVEEYATWIVKGGWPDGINDIESQAIIRMKQYVDALCKEDVNKVTSSKFNELKMRKLLESLARNTASEVTNTKIRDDVSALDESISLNTLTDYLDVLNKLYIIEDLKPWNPNLRSKTVIRSTSARFFTDPSIAAAALRITSKQLCNDFKTFGFLFESLVLRDLRVYAENLNGEVFRYKDKSGLEVDMIVHLPDGRWGAIEVKMGSHEFDIASENLHKLANRIDTETMQKPSFLAIISATPYAYTREDGVHVIPLGVLKD